MLLRFGAYDPGFRVSSSNSPPPFNPPFPLGVRGRGVEGEEGEGETGPEQKIAANYADSAAEDNRKRQADG